MAKKLAKIERGREPSKDAVEQAKAAGAEIRAYHPERLRAFLEGGITLGELQGIGKDAQYQMAKIGFDFLTEGKYDSARKVFEGLVALDPFDAYFQIALGSVAQREGKLEEADRRYSRALEINPFSAPASANRGEVRLALGKLQEAIADFLRAIQEDPQGQDPSTRRARVMIDSMKRQLEANQADPEAAAAKTSSPTKPAALPQKSKTDPQGKK